MMLSLFALALAQPVPAVTESVQEPGTSRRASFVPSDLSTKYVLVAGQRDQVPAYRFQRPRDRVTCTATLNTGELLFTAEGRYELKLQYGYACGQTRPATARFTSYAKGDFLLAPDGITFFHDVALDGQKGMNLLGAFEATFDHALMYTGVRTVQEARGQRRAFEALLIGVNRVAGDQEGGRRRPVMLWFVPDEISTWTAREHCPVSSSQSDSLWLLSRGRSPLRGGVSALTEGSWRAVAVPAQADTVPLLHLGFECGEGGRMAAVAERFNRYVAVDTGLFSSVTSHGSVQEGIVRWRAHDGTLRPAALQISCEGPSPCRIAVVDADTLAVWTRTENAARAEAERERREREARQAASADEARRRARFLGAGATGDQLSAAMAGQVTVGMGQGLVREVLGPPQRTEDRATELGSVLLWYYPGRTIEFSGGRVRSVR